MQIDLFRFIRPQPGYIRAAVWTFPLARQVIICDGITNAFYNLVIAVGAKGAFVLANMAGDVARVDITEASFSSDFGGA